MRNNVIEGDDMSYDENKTAQFLEEIAKVSEELDEILFYYEEICSCLVLYLRSAVDEKAFNLVMRSFANLPSSQELRSAGDQLRNYAEVVRTFFRRCSALDKDSLARLNWVLMRILHTINIAGFSMLVNEVRKVSAHAKASELTVRNYEWFKNKWNNCIERLTVISESVGVKFPRASMFLPELEIPTENVENWLSETYKKVFALLKPQLGEQICSQLLVCLAYAESSYPYFLEVVFFHSEEHGVRVLSLSDENYSGLVLKGRILRTLCAYTLRRAIPQEIDLENEVVLVRQIVSQRLKNERSLVDLQKELEKRLESLGLKRVSSLIGEMNNRFAQNQFGECLVKAHEFFTEVIAAGLEYRKEKGLLLLGETFERYFDVVSAGFHKEVPEHLKKAGLSMKDWTGFLMYDTCWESLRYLIFCENPPPALSRKGELLGQALGTLSSLAGEALIMPSTSAVTCHITKYFHPASLLGSSVVLPKSGQGIIWMPK